MAAYEKNRLQGLVGDTERCFLKPLCFFVSWQGVLTLAYSGFPVSLVTLKAKVSETVPGIVKENPGSLWPKTTLAPLKDRKRLSPAQLERLNALCKSLEQTLLVEECNLAFEEGTSQWHQIRSGGISDIDYKILKISEEESDRVNAVISEADSDDYWFAASRDGNRETHYREPSFGCTLMVPWGRHIADDECVAPHNLMTIITQFKKCVEIEFPGLYAWLSPESYHVTLRAIH